MGRWIYITYHIQAMNDASSPEMPTTDERRINIYWFNVDNRFFFFYNFDFEFMDFPNLNFMCLLPQSINVYLISFCLDNYVNRDTFSRNLLNSLRIEKESKQNQNNVNQFYINFAIYKWSW